MALDEMIVVPGFLRRLLLLFFCAGMTPYSIRPLAGRMNNLNHAATAKHPIKGFA